MIDSSKLKRRFYKHLWIFKPISYLLFFSLVIFSVVFLTPKIKKTFGSFLQIPAAVISVLNPSITKLNSYQDRTNILLLGTAGGNHPGADLTDSIMLISINLKTADTVIVSLPRDIWVKSLSAKLNTAYYFGQLKQPQGGLILAKSAVSEIINQPVHYTVLLDFSGFQKAIDIVGGLDLYVPHAFIDEKYPIPGKESIEPVSDRFQTISFQSGDQHFDGTTALKYVRSRNAQGEEGTDYARAQRQQRTILAFKTKLLSLKTLLNFQKLKSLNQTFKDSVKTDISSSAYIDLAKLALKVNQNQIRTGVINQGSDIEDIPPLLYNPPVSLYGQWVLLPVNNDWDSLHQYIEEIIYQNQ